MLRAPELAGLAAEKFVRDLGIAELPVDPFAIAENELGITVEAKPASAKGVSGMLIRVGDEYAIAYATHIKSKGFQRFSVGHEIGHFNLPGHLDHLFSGGQTVHQSHAGFNSGDPYEQEADYYAAGLLMPDHLFVPLMRSVGEGLDAVVALSGACQTSIEATTIRYIQRTEIPAAVIRSEGQRIDYCFMSEALKEVDGLEWIRKGMSVPGGTETERFNADRKNVRVGRRVCDTTVVRDWFGGEWHVELEEEVQGLGEYGKTLSLLYAADASVFEEAKEDAELGASYEARLRKR